MRYSISTVVAILLGVQSVYAIDNGVGLTPAMGWNSWNKYACNINETLIMQTADTIVNLVLDKLRYQYVNIDDCWMTAMRTPEGQIKPDPIRFPSGMKALADYIHSKGLKFGVYSSAGTYTC